MCVEIIKLEEQQSYKPELPFVDQIMDSKEILIDCNPDCPKVAKFLDEVEKICRNGQTLPIHIKLADNSNINLFKKTKQLNNDLLINDIIGQTVLIHKNADNKLKELSELCLKGQCSE